VTVSIAGPDPNPKKPDLPTPLKACDSHAHIFGPSTKFPYADGRAYTPPDATVEMYLSMLDALGVARGVLVQGNAHGIDNSVILDAVQRYPDRLRGVAIVDESINPQELYRWDRIGILGLRFHLYSGSRKPSYKQAVDWDVFEKLCPYMAKMNWHMQAWVDWRLLPELELKIKALPVPVVIDHMMMMDAQKGVNDPTFQTLLRLLGAGKCWVKLSGLSRISQQYPDFKDARPLHEALVKTNPEQLFWGSDWPHTKIDAKVMPNDGYLLDLFNAWTPEENIRQSILVENPAKFYRFNT
jgi:predicted TIM-barrel fold metal-dependent hydrolase